MRTKSPCIRTHISFFIIAADGAGEGGAEKANVYGSIVAEKSKWPIRGAHVLLVRLNGDKVDSLYRVSTKDGLFTYKNLNPGRVYIKATSMRNNPAEGVFDLGVGDNAVLFTMSPSSERIAESRVFGNVALMKQLGDTTIFNAAAVKTIEGEKAIAILEQLPGFEIGKGVIKYRGKKIARTYVNGMQIFGNEATKTFNMLLADEVSHVRVYEEQNAEDTHRGLKHSEKEQVIDVKTKASIVALTSMEAQLSAGADGALAENGAMQGRYYARAMAEFNSEMNNASAYIGADNVTSGLEGSKYTFVPSVSRTGFGPLQSYNENLGGKLYFEHRWKDRRYGNLIGAGYSTTHSYSCSASRALSEYFETYNSPARSYIDTTIGTARQMNHDFVLNGDFKNTILNDLAFSLNGTVKESNNYGHSSNLLISSLGRVRQNTITGNNGNDVKINGSFIWKNNDLGKIRPRLTLSGAFANNNTLSWNTDTLSSSYIRRNLQSDGLGKSWKIEAKSDLDIVLANDTQKTSKLNFAAFAGMEKSIKRNITVDIINPDSPVRDFANTYDYSWNTVSGGLSQNYTITKGKETFKVSLTESISSQRDEEHFPARISYNHLYFDLRPEISYNNKLFSAGISAQSQIPSVEQTRNRITDRNPLVLSGGNPELKQSYTVNASVLDNIFMDKKTGMNMGCSLYASYTFKPIVTRSFYFKEDTSLDAYNNYLAKKGAVLNTFVNSPRPAYNLGGSISLSHRAQAVKLNSSLKLNASLNSLPQFLRDKLAKISTYRLGAEVKEAYRPNKKLSINLNLEASYLNSQSDISGLLTSAIVSEARLGATYNFTRNTYLNAAGALNRHDYIAGAGKSNIYAPMSISISHRLKNLSIHISAQDLLNKASNYTTSTTADYHMARWTPSYGRYFLCGVIYEFRKKR